MNKEQMVEKFQCPGCVCGSDLTCGKYHWDEAQNQCMGHVLGTMILGVGSFALGLPKGFDKPGRTNRDELQNFMRIRLWPTGEQPVWNHLNVPVWALEQDGYLFVRTYAPRINTGWVDVIPGGTLTLVPQAINVADFYNEID